MEEKGRKGRRFRLRFVLLLVLIVVAVLGVIFRPAISAQYRAAIVLSSVLEPPVLTPLAETLTNEPTIEETTITGVPTLVARPGGEGPYPALVFMNGAVPPGNDEPTVRRLARGLARAGYAVYVPEVAGLKSGEISSGTVPETVRVARAVADAADTKGERVGFVGVSVGGSLALLAARDDSLEDRVSVVSCLAPYTDLENVLRLATTGTYPGEGEYYGGGTPHYLRVITVRSAVSLLPEGEERDSLLRLVPELRHYYGAGPDTADPLVAIPAFKVVNDDELSPETESLIKLLLNRDPERFDELYADLSPRMREEIEALSPASGANRIEAPVEIASAPRDEYFPVAESKMLEGDVPDLRLTVTPALKHVEPDPEDIPALLALNGFVVRSFEEASSEK